MSVHMKKPLIKVSVGSKRFKIPQQEAKAVLAIVKSIEHLNHSTNKSAHVIYREFAKNRCKGAIYLRGIRTRENISQKVLEKKTGIPVTNISKYESGSRKITESVAKKLAKALDIKSSKLLLK